MDCFFCIFFSADIIAELRRKYFRDNETTNINAVRHNVLDCLFNAIWKGQALIQELVLMWYTVLFNAFVFYRYMWLYVIT